MNAPTAPRTWRDNDPEPADHPDVKQDDGRVWRFERGQWHSGVATSGWDQIFWSTTTLTEMVPDPTRYLRVPDEAHHLFALRPGGVVEHFDLCHQVWHPAPAEVLKDIAETFGDMTEVAYSDLPAVAQ